MFLEEGELMSANKKSHGKYEIKDCTVASTVYCTCADKREILKTLVFFRARIAAY
jgi:hypothetical protein